MPLKLVDPGRAQFTGSVTASELDELAANSAVKVLQTSGPVESSTWALVDEVFFGRRPDVELRIYGFHGHPCDLSFVPEDLVPVLRNPSVKRVSVGFGSDRKNAAARALLKSHGKEELRRTPFVLR